MTIGLSIKPGFKTIYMYFINVTSMKRPVSNFDNAVRNCNTFQTLATNKRSVLNICLPIWYGVVRY